MADEETSLMVPEFIETTAIDIRFLLRREGGTKQKTLCV